MDQYEHRQGRQQRMMATLTGQEILLDVTLHAAEQKWTKNFVERLYYLLAFLLIIICRGVILVQECFQIRIVNENLGAYEVEQSKQLLQVVLQGRPGDKKSSAR